MCTLQQAHLVCWHQVARRAGGQWSFPALILHQEEVLPAVLGKEEATQAGAGVRQGRGKVISRVSEQSPVSAFPTLPVGLSGAHGSCDDGRHKLVHLCPPAAVEGAGDSCLGSFQQSGSISAGPVSVSLQTHSPPHWWLSPVKHK